MYIFIVNIYLDEHWRPVSPNIVDTKTPSN